MKHADINLIEGTAALATLEQITEEFAKEKWDARLIPGLRYAPHTTNYYIDFQRIPVIFRPVVKEHVKCKLATGVSASTLHLCTYCLGNFLAFFVQQYPHANSLQALSKQDIDTFILALKAEGEAHGWTTNNQRIHNHISSLEELLCYLERAHSPLRPIEPRAHIIWPSHYPRVHYHPHAQVKYIPQTVLTQLDAHLQHLLPTYIPIVILLRASGWRISDVLYLKLDTCLERDGDTFWLVGDIQKTHVLGHKIPITKEVAAVILTQIAWVKQQYTPEENPKRWLFPALKSKEGYYSSQRFLHGDPLNAKNVSRALDSLVKKYQLQDEAGNLFYFKLHAFRHTKGMELVNNGMSLLMVQQWMAHASPEMTLIYAKVLDETMRMQWEKAIQHGIVQFNDGKPEYVPGKKMLTVLHEPQAFDPERVRNYRANTKLPVGNCVKSPKLICKFTELPCFHCPAYVLTPDDLPALETYEQQILERIEIGTQANNAYWIEVNQKNLDERVRPAIAMLKQGHIVAKSEKYEREYTQEEWEQPQAQQHAQEETHE
jgi:integrase